MFGCEVDDGEGPDDGDTPVGDGDATDDNGDTPDDADDGTDDGDEDPDETLEPGAMQLALGHRFSCALEREGNISCWGRNQFGQLGQGHTQILGDDELPDAAGPLEMGRPVTSIAAGREHACAIRADQLLVCWGMSMSGQLGYGDLNIIGNNELPRDAGVVDVGAKVQTIKAGPQTTCAITNNHALVCWGANASGQLGYGHNQQIGDDEAPSSAGAVEVGGQVIDVALGWTNTCAVLADGDVRCWGESGPALGTGYAVGETIGDDELPIVMAPLDLGGAAQAITAGNAHVCALMETGEVMCWGDNSRGQLGYGNYFDVGQDQTPASVGPVPLGEPAIAVVAGSFHTCAIGESGSAYCWGDDNVALGYPNIMQSIGGTLRPVDVGPINLPGAVKEIAAGPSHTCARIGPEVYCWGAGMDGALGYGSEADIGYSQAAGSGGPVQFLGGEGHGGVEPIADELDGVPDVAISLSGPDPQLPTTLEIGQTVRVTGSYWGAFDVDDGTTNSAVVRGADGETLILAAIREPRRFHPRVGILNMLGLDPKSWLAPLDLSPLDLDLCSKLGDADQVGTRLFLDVNHPDAPVSRLLDSTRGRVGGGYLVSVNELQDWTRGGALDQDLSSYSMVAVLQNCAPDCGPSDLINSCEPPSTDLNHASVHFYPARQPLDPGYDLSCEVLDNTEGFLGWQVELDCVGLR